MLSGRSGWSASASANSVIPSQRPTTRRRSNLSGGGRSGGPAQSETRRWWVGRGIDQRTRVCLKHRQPPASLQSSASASGAQQVLNPRATPPAGRPGTLTTVTRLQAWTRLVLLGPEGSWGATVATGRRGIHALAVVALAMHLLDLATGLRMMLVYGVHLEQNPLARFVMSSGGPLALTELKLGVVTAGLVLFVRT